MTCKLSLIEIEYIQKSVRKEGTILLKLKTRRRNEKHKLNYKLHNIKTKLRLE